MPIQSTKHQVTDERTALTDLYDMPGYLIRRLQQAAVSTFVSTVTEAGFDLTPVQFGVLTIIGRHPGIDQSTLADRIDYDRATIGDVVDRLCEKGLVRRTVNPLDRRARVLKLTTKGTRMITLVTPIVHESQQKILAGLSETERANFMAMMRKLI